MPTQVVYPPVEVFDQTPQWATRAEPESITKSLGGYQANNWKETICPNDEGIYSTYFDHPFKRKGHVYPEAVTANNMVKRVTLAIWMPFVSKEMALPMLGFLILPFRMKLKWFNKLLERYVRLAESIYESVFPVPFLKRQHYKNVGREMWTLVETSLVEIGITPWIAEKIGRIAATLIEYDDVYQYILEDLFSESSKESFLRNPRKEIKRLMETLSKRQGSKVFSEKFRAFTNILTFALWLPKYRKALMTALEKVNFPKLQLDEDDRFFCLTKPEYDYFGQSFELRMTQYYKMCNLNINN